MSETKRKLEPVRRKIDLVYQQIYVNNRFLEIFEQIGNELINEAIEYIFNRYKRYPNFQVLDEARKRIRGVGILRRNPDLMIPSKRR